MLFYKTMFAFFLVLVSPVWSSQPAPWHPDIPPQGAAIEPRNVRIVKQGLEHQRSYDGNCHGILHYHRYKIYRDSKTNLWERRVSHDDLKQYHNFDVDGDGIATNDSVGCHPFDLSKDNPMSMHAPFYDTTVGSHRFYGGATIYQANIDYAGFSEDGMNDSEEGPSFQPRRNWTYFHETYEIYSPYRMYFTALWQKHDFMNGGADHRVSFDEESRVAFLVMRYYMGIEGFRFVVRNGDTFYISERTYHGSGYPLGQSGGAQHTIYPARERWAIYNPTPPYHIDFDPENAEYAPVRFDDVTAVGWYMYKDQLISGYVGHKWYAFEADAVVHAPARPSNYMAMTPVEEGDLPEFYMADCEVPYELWRKVHKQGRANAFVNEPRGCNFEERGDMGSMDFTGPDGHYLRHGQHEPVTDITLLDMIVWCNALSGMESREPCYYEDEQRTIPFREIKQCPRYTNQRKIPVLYVKWEADGYRLPTAAEWVAATGTKAVTPPARSYTTHAVGSAAPGGKPPFDMAGNVWEVVWPYGDSLDPAKAHSVLALGGAFTGESPESISASPYGDRPFYGRGDIGFRPVRRRAGLKSPKQETPENTAPAWLIGKATLTKSKPASQDAVPMHEPLLKLSAVPERSYKVGTYEVCYAEWMRVYHWACANGYTFEYDGEMGSMAYWGFGKNWEPGLHSAEEPVTGISSYDMMIWCNALSEIEGRTPVYREEDNHDSVVRTSHPYRPFQLLLQEAWQGTYDGWVNRDFTSSWRSYYRDPTADGYRLPTTDEFDYILFCGETKKYPWGTNALDVFDHAWLADTSGFTTHKRRQKRPSAWGLYDVAGNVSEICHQGGGIRTSDKTRGYAFRCGGSFMDILVDLYTQPFRAAQTAFGLAYPDVGFRVLKQAPVERSAKQRLLNALKQPGLLGHVKLQANTLTQGQPAPVSRSKIEQSRSFDLMQGRVHRGNLHRTGFHPDATGARQGEIVWKFKTGGPVRSSPVVVDGILYVGSYDGHLYAIHSDNGELIWKYKTSGRVAGSIAATDTMIFFTSEEGTLHALDLQTGQPRWTASIGGKPAGSPAVMGSTVFAAPGHHRGGSEVLVMNAQPIVGFDVESGEKIWQTGLGPQGYAALCTEGKRIYSGFQGSTYAAFNLATAKVDWRCNLGHQNRQFMSLVYYKDKVIIPGAMRGSVAVVDPEKNAHIVWHRGARKEQLDMELNQGALFGYEILTDPAVADDVIYIGCNDGQLHTFAFEDGERGWTFQTGGSVQSSPSIAKDTVFFGSWDHHLYALDRHSGELQWQLDLGDRIISSPCPTDDRIFVGCDNGYIYAIK